MYKKIQNIFFSVIFFIFLFFVTKYYFSEQNLIFTNKSRTSYLTTLQKSKEDLPILKNDTDNVVFYIDDLENFKDKRKKRQAFFYDEAPSLETPSTV